MTAKDKKNLKVLLVLLGILALTAVLGYQMKGPSSVSALETPQKKTSANPPAEEKARIRTDLVERRPSSVGVGDDNIFQYRAGRIEPQPPPAAPPPPVIIAEPVLPAEPPPPPPPPPIPLKYNGFANSNDGLTAFLSDDQRSYIVRSAEILMGRYRIVRVTTTAVEVEDLQYNRRQMLPLLK